MVHWYDTWMRLIVIPRVDHSYAVRVAAAVPNSDCPILQEQTHRGSTAQQEDSCKQRCVKPALKGYLALVRSPMLRTCKLRSSPASEYRGWSTATPTAAACCQPADITDYNRTSLEERYLSLINTTADKYSADAVQLQQTVCTTAEGHQQCSPQMQKQAAG